MYESDERFMKLFFWVVAIRWRLLVVADGITEIWSGDGSGNENDYLACDDLNLLGDPCERQGRVQGIRDDSVMMLGCKKKI